MENMDESSIRQRMEQVVGLVRQDTGAIRTGRATPALVEDIMVEAYGGTQKLKVVELASITAPDPQTLVINPWDKSIIGEMKQAIDLANIGLSPAIAGELIRINMPPMTAEDRENFIRLLHQKLENGRIMVRQVRHEWMEKIRAGFEQKEIVEDEKFGQEKRLQELTDEYIGMIDELGKAKEEELKTI